MFVCVCVRACVVHLNVHLKHTRFYFAILKKYFNLRQAIFHEIFGFDRETGMRASNPGDSSIFRESWQV